MSKPTVLHVLALIAASGAPMVTSSAATSTFAQAATSTAVYRTAANNRIEYFVNNKDAEGFNSAAQEDFQTGNQTGSSVGPSTASASAIAFASSQNFLTAQATAHNLADAGASARWLGDRIRIGGPGALPFEHITINLSVHGTMRITAAVGNVDEFFGTRSMGQISVSATGTPLHTASLTAGVGFRPGTGWDNNPVVSAVLTGSVRTAEILGAFHAVVPIDHATNSYVFSAGLSVDAFAGYGGDSTTDASHTLSLVSITLPDGTTPESHGYSLSFDSGMTSPNVAAVVPEPSTLTLAGIAGVLGLGYAWRRRRGGA